MFKIEDYKGLNILNVLDTEAQKGIYQAYWDSVFCNYGNNVEWQKLRNHIYLCEETKNYIYSTPSATKYEQGKRPILDAVVWKVTKDLATDREKVLALLAFIRDLYLTHGKHFPFDFYGGTEEMLIEKGENLCECVSRLMVSLAEVIGIPGRIICHVVSGHYVCELYLEEKWCYFDPRFGIFYVDADEKFLSVLEIMFAAVPFKNVSKLKSIRAKVMTIKNGKSIFFEEDDIGTGEKIEIKPRTTSMLNRFEPTTFPTAISTLPSIALVMLTESSGKLVPRATIVRPIKSDGTLRRSATALAPETK